VAFGRPGGSVGFRGLSTAEEGVGKSAPAVPAVHAPCGCGRGLVHSPAEAQPPGCLAVGCSAAPHSRGGGQGEGANRGAVLTVPPAGAGGRNRRPLRGHPPGTRRTRLGWATEQPAQQKGGGPRGQGWQGPGRPPVGRQQAAQGVGVGWELAGRLRASGPCPRPCTGRPPGRGQGTAWPGVRLAARGRCWGVAAAPRGGGRSPPGAGRPGARGAAPRVFGCSSGSSRLELCRRPARPEPGRRGFDGPPQKGGRRSHLGRGPGGGFAPPLAHWFAKQTVVSTFPLRWLILSRTIRA